MKAIQQAAFVGLAELAILLSLPAVVLAGAIVVWGDDTDGVISHAPKGSDFVRIAGSGGGALALRSDGSIAVWGDNTFGQVSHAPKGAGFKAIAGDGMR